MFQSHAGSIEAPTWGEEAGASSRFNPTLVRLRHITPRDFFIALLGFNPTLVRLRRVMKIEPASDEIEFQSHAGSIEAPPLLDAAVCPLQVSIPRWFD